MLKAGANGDASLCLPSVPQEDKDQYCDSKFYDNLEENKTCKEPYSFCYLCCDSEFGDLNADMRNDCF